MDSTIRIAMISDKDFFMPTYIAIQSMKENKNEKSIYKIYVFLCQCEEEQKQQLKAMETNNFIIDIRMMGRREEHDIFVNSNISATPTALYKFSLPELLKEDKILYLDGDMLIESDLQELFSIELGEKYAAVVKDMPLMIANTPQYKKIHSKNENYFNSGMMLLNLKKIREDKIQEKLYRYKEQGINFFMDQDALNVIFNDNVYFLSCYYNMVFRLLDNYPLEVICNFYNIPVEMKEEDLLKKAKILHMASKFKPWKYYTSFLTERFLYYYERSIFKDNHLHIEEHNPGAKYVKIRKVQLESLDARNLFICRNIIDVVQAIRLKKYYCDYEECDIVIVDKIKIDINVLKQEFVKVIIQEDEVVEKYYLELNDGFYSDVYTSSITRITEFILSRHVLCKKLCKLHMFASDLESYFFDLSKWKYFNIDMFNLLIDKSFYDYSDGIALQEMRNNIVPFPALEVNKKTYDITIENGLKKCEIKTKFIFFIESNDICQFSFFEKVREVVGRENLTLILEGDAKKFSLLNINNVIIADINEVLNYLICTTNKHILISNQNRQINNFWLLNYDTYKVINISNIIEGRGEKKIEVPVLKKYKNNYTPKSMDELNILLRSL